MSGHGKLRLRPPTTISQIKTSAYIHTCIDMNTCICVYMCIKMQINVHTHPERIVDGFCTRRLPEIHQSAMLKTKADIKLILKAPSFHDSSGEACLGGGRCSLGIGA